MSVRIMTDNRIRLIKEVTANGERPGLRWSDRTVLALIARLEAAEEQIDAEFWRREEEPR